MPEFSELESISTGEGSSRRLEIRVKSGDSEEVAKEVMNQEEVEPEASEPEAENA
jgi:hypothetical protein